GSLLQTAPERLAIAGNRVVVRDAPSGPSLDLSAIARDAGGELTAEATFTIDHMTYPYGMHIAQVRIDRDSCAVTVERSDTILAVPSIRCWSKGRLPAGPRKVSVRRCLRNLCTTMPANRCR